MSNVLALNFEQNEVRIVKDEAGEPWFVAIDVCRTLGLSNATKALLKVDDDCLKTFQVLDSRGLLRDTTILNESGLYQLIMRSTKEEAKRFRKWVTSEVLPSIRKTGGYTVAQMAAPMPVNLSPLEMLNHMQTLIDLNKVSLAENQKLEQEKLLLSATVETKSAEIIQLKPKADFHDKYADASGLTGVRDMSSIVGIPEKKFIQWGIENGLWFKSQVDNTLRPKAEYKANGFLALKTFYTPYGTVCYHMKITSLGVTGIAALVDMDPDVKELRKPVSPMVKIRRYLGGED